MDSQNPKGQAILEMVFVMMFFILFWTCLQRSIENQNSSFKKWKIGHDTKVQFKKGP